MTENSHEHLDRLYHTLGVTPPGVETTSKSISGQLADLSADPKQQINAVVDFLKEKIQHYLFSASQGKETTPAGIAHMVRQLDQGVITQTDITKKINKYLGVYLAAIYKERTSEPGPSMPTFPKVGSNLSMGEIIKVHKTAMQKPIQKKEIFTADIIDNIIFLLLTCHDNLYPDAFAYRACNLESQQRDVLSKLMMSSISQEDSSSTSSKEYQYGVSGKEILFPLYQEAMARTLHTCKNGTDIETTFLQQKDSVIQTRYEILLEDFTGIIYTMSTQNHDTKDIASILGYIHSLYLLLSQDYFSHNTDKQQSVKKQMRISTKNLLLEGDIREDWDNFLIIQSHTTGSILDWLELVFDKRKIHQTSKIMPMAYDLHPGEINNLSHQFTGVTFETEENLFAGNIFEIKSITQLPPAVGHELLFNTLEDAHDIITQQITRGRYKIGTKLDSTYSFIKNLTNLADNSDNSYGSLTRIKTTTNRLIDSIYNYCNYTSHETILPKVLAYISDKTSDELWTIVRCCKVIIQYIDQINEVSNKKNKTILQKIIKKVPTLIEGPDKDPVRILDKMIQANGGRTIAIHKPPISDFARAKSVDTTVLDQHERLRTILRAIKNDPDINITVSTVMIKNTNSTLGTDPKKKSGYRDIKIFLICDDGSTIEIQILTQEMNRWKHIGIPFTELEGIIRDLLHGKKDTYNTVITYLKKNLKPSDTVSGDDLYALIRTLPENEELVQTTSVTNKQLKDILSAIERNGFIEAWKKDTRNTITQEIKIKIKQNNGIISSHDLEILLYIVLLKNQINWNQQDKKQFIDACLLYIYCCPRNYETSIEHDDNITNKQSGESGTESVRFSLADLKLLQKQYNEDENNKNTSRGINIYRLIDQVIQMLEEKG